MIIATISELVASPSQDVNDRLVYIGLISRRLRFSKKLYKEASFSLLIGQLGLGKLIAPGSTGDIARLILLTFYISWNVNRRTFILS